MAATFRKIVLNNPAARNFSRSQALEYTYTPTRVVKNTHYGESAEIWKRIFYFVSLPSIILLQAYCYTLPHEPRPEFIEYEHLRIRRKPLPWRDGVKSLFHHPARNALPGIGYEEDEHH